MALGACTPVLPAHIGKNCACSSGSPSRKALRGSRNVAVWKGCHYGSPNSWHRASSQSSVGAAIAGLSPQPVTLSQGGLWLLPICLSWDFPAAATEPSGTWKLIFGDFLITGTESVQPQGCLGLRSSFGFFLHLIES